MPTRRHLPFVIVLLLPLLLLRALLPGGYMPLAEAGEIRLVLCSEGLQQGGDSDRDPSHPEPADGGSCPFAPATFKGSPPHVPVASAMPAPHGQVLPFDTVDIPLANGPARSASARAPPALS